MKRLFPVVPHPTCRSAGNKFVLAYGSDKSVPAFGNITSPRDLLTYTKNVVSSSTSIVDNGSCQTPGSVSRWSAIGAHKGRILLVSSTKTGTTSAAELCPVFKALLFKNALRLDGGPSTSMFVSGELLNELDGRAFVKYGRSRRVVYPLRISN